MPPKPPLTHFLCLPLINDTSRSQLRTSLQQLTADLLSSDVLADFPNPEKAIRPLGTLHLTIGVMSLIAPEELARALTLLQEIDTQRLMMLPPPPGTEITESTPEQVPPQGVTSAAGPLTISLKSLASMHPPKKTSVLYSIPVDDTGRLQPFCRELRQAFEKAGLITVEDRPLLLHATMVNTIYAADRKGKGRGRGGKSNAGHGRNKGKLTFVATDILDQYDGFEFARDVQLDKIAICEMGAKKLLDADGQVLGEEYTTVSERAL